MFENHLRQVLTHEAREEPGRIKSLGTEKRTNVFIFYTSVYIVTLFVWQIKAGTKHMCFMSNNLMM